MSGLCGICDLGREMGLSILAPMIEALTLPGEAPPEFSGGTSAVLGIASRWSFQRVAAIPWVRVAADADLLNIRELRKELAKEGASPSSPSVAELLARLYALRGPSFLESLRGSFALALWDERAQRLLLAVDRIGIRGLYWRREGNRLVFASRAAAIRAVQIAPIEINPAAVVQYLLFSVVPAPLSIDSGTEKLLPGTLLIYENGGLRLRQYWDLKYPESDRHDVSHWACELREGMRSAVHRHLEGITPERTGAYLSGGTDSSSVVAFMNERHSPVSTFSIYFQEAGFSEISFAHTTAKCFSTRHYEKCLRPSDVIDAIPRIMRYYDEPFANSSAIGAYHCAHVARQNGMETLLAGDGGDELFAGNARYALDHQFALYHSLPRWLRARIIEPLLDTLPWNGGWLSLPGRYVRRAEIPNPRRILSYSFLLNCKPEEIFEPDFLAQVPSDTWLGIAERHFHAAQAQSELNRLLYLDVKMTLADNDLRKVAGTAELAGVHVRFPLLDEQLAELSGRIPASLKMKGFRKRYIFKEAMKGILPRKVLYKKKHGFGVPLGRWLLEEPRLNELLRSVLNDPRTRQRGYFRPAFFDRLMNLQLTEQPNYYGEIAWYLLALELWHREHTDWKHEGVHAW